jgi:hypothetical protein
MKGASAVVVWRKLSGRSSSLLISLGGRLMKYGLTGWWLVSAAVASEQDFIPISAYVGQKLSPDDKKALTASEDAVKETKR